MSVADLDNVQVREPGGESESDAGAGPLTRLHEDPPQHAPPPRHTQGSNFLFSFDKMQNI